MIALDADVLTDIVAGHPGLMQRAALVPAEQQSVPVIVVEEMIRGRLNSIRQAEACKSNLTTERAYQLFEATLGRISADSSAPLHDCRQGPVSAVAQTEDSRRDGRLALSS